VVQAFESDRRRAGGLLAGGLAYKVFLWLIPLVLFLVSAFGLVTDLAGDDPADLARQTGMTAALASAISQAVAASHSGRWWLLVLGALLTVWAGRGVYRGVRLVSELAWDTRSVSNGAHTLAALATDIDGHTTLSAPVAVNVANGTFFQNQILATGFNLPTAIKLARALEEFEPYWYEDPLKMDNLDAVAEYAHRTNVWVTASETLGTRWGFRDLFEKRAASVCMLDVGWCGGLSESKKIATLAECYQLPVAPHDCTGPVLLTASVHLSMNCPNTLVQEVVRAFYHDWYGKLVTALPPLKDGYITAPPGPGLGTRLQPDVLKRKDARIRRSAV